MSASGEHDRLTGNLIMFGVIAALDEQQARVRVNADGLLTDWLPWIERRAGSVVRTWLVPEIGEQVVIACPYGDPAQGVVIGSVYQNAYPAPADRKAIHRTIYGDGTSIEYDLEATALTLNVGRGSVVINCAQATARAIDSITLDSPEVRITGTARVDADLNVAGDATAGRDVKGGSISLKSHHHTAQGPTAPTIPAEP